MNLTQFSYNFYPFETMIESKFLHLTASKNFSFLTLNNFKPFYLRILFSTEAEDLANNIDFIK